MEQVQEERFVFQTEWFDKQADLIRGYLLTFYPGDNSIDMVSTFHKTRASHSQPSLVSFSTI